MSVPHHVCVVSRSQDCYRADHLLEARITAMLEDPQAPLRGDAKAEAERDLEAVDGMDR